MVVESLRENSKGHWQISQIRWSSSANQIWAYIPLPLWIVESEKRRKQLLLLLTTSTLIGSIRIHPRCWGKGSDRFFKCFFLSFFFFVDNEYRERVLNQMFLALCSYCFQIWKIIPKKIKKHFLFIDWVYTNLLVESANFGNPRNCANYIV